MLQVQSEERKHCINRYRPSDTNYVDVTFPFGGGHSMHQYVM